MIYLWLMVNSIDPDQTVPEGAVCLGSTHYLSTQYSGE